MVAEDFEVYNTQKFKHGTWHSGYRRQLNPLTYPKKECEINIR